MANSRLRHVIVSGVTVAVMSPSLGWIRQAWINSPLDHSGPLFAGLGLGWAVLVIAVVRAREGVFERAAWPLLLLALGAGGIAVLFNVNVLLAVAGVLCSWGFAWGLYGATLGLLLLPSALCLVLALPTTSYLIDGLLGLLGLPSLSPFAVKLGVAMTTLGLGGMGLALARKGRAISPGPMATSYSVLAVLALSGLSLALRPPTFGPAVRLDEQQWAFGAWLGAEIPSSPIEQRLYQDYRLSKRAYATNDGDMVAMLIVESDDVHKLHSPAYCLRGSGWQVEHNGLSQRAFGQVATVAAGLHAVRDGNELEGVYWYSSRSRSTADLVGLRLRSSLVPGEPFTLYMVTAVAAVTSSAEQVLADFLAAAPWQIQ